MVAQNMNATLTADVWKKCQIIHVFIAWEYSPTSPVWAIGFLKLCYVSLLLLRKTIEMFSSSSECGRIFLCPKASVFGEFQKSFESLFQHPDLQFCKWIFKNILLIFWNIKMFAIILYNLVLIMLYQKCLYHFEMFLTRAAPCKWIK